MQTYLNIALILVSLFLVVAVLLQVRGQGSGFFGQATATFRVRRGIEKTLFQFTIALIVMFVVIAVLSVRLVS